MPENDISEPAVQALIAAINDGDRRAFVAALTPDATMSDDGTDRDVKLCDEIIEEVLPDAP